MPCLSASPFDMPPGFNCWCHASVPPGLHTPRDPGNPPIPAQEIMPGLGKECTGHWRSAEHPKRICKRQDDKCWFCRDNVRMSRSHTLLHCSNERLKATRADAWEGKSPSGVRVLLGNPRWKRRFLRFLELSGVERTTADGTDEDGAHAAATDEWIVWRQRRG